MYMSGLLLEGQRGSWCIAPSYRLVQSGFGMLESEADELLLMVLRGPPEAW